MAIRRSKPWFHGDRFFGIFRKKRTPAEAIEFGNTVRIAILWNI